MFLFVSYFFHSGEPYYLVLLLKKGVIIGERKGHIYVHIMYLRQNKALLSKLIG